MTTIDRRRRAAPCPREEGRYKWKGVEYELTTPSMILKIINSVDDSKDGHYYPLGRFLARIMVFGSRSITNAVAPGRRSSITRPSPSIGYVPPCTGARSVRMRSIWPRLPVTRL